ncbi:toll/interleukin-1 receptor domain-containing protein [Candidatus Halobeggiatoa sp. HSG11]|nr:toll/interleukin-1 receptor domain-containing protein [Candidatus Halobeggiatoa sp. HSG11]
MYVSNYTNDIFISYAQVDNEPLTGAENGWVTTLIKTLETQLGQKLGHADAFTLWMDSELRGSSSITSETIKQLNESATIVLILSPAYLASQWCQRELDYFMSLVGENSERVFVVEYNKIEAEQRPYHLSELRGYQLWITDEKSRSHTLAIPKPHPEEREYYQRIDDLTHDLTHKLKELKTKTITPAVAINKSSLQHTVFLAEVTPDLEERRNEVKRYLEQQGVAVLPNKKYSFQAELDHDLEQACLFVQLVSEQADLFNSNQIQYERAKAADLSMLQWHDPDLTPQKMQASPNSTLLQSNSIIATELVEFQEMVWRKLQPQPDKNFPVINDGHLVFVNTAPEDKVLANEIQAILDEAGVGYILPMDIVPTTQPEEIRADLESNLLECDALIVPYYQTPLAKVRQYLMSCRRLQPQRTKPFKVIAVCDKPLPNKSALNMKLPGMQILKCSSLQIETCLPKFMRSLTK